MFGHDGAMALAPSFPLVARGRRGKGPRGKRQARQLRDRRLAALAVDRRIRRTSTKRAPDDAGTLDLDAIGGDVIRPGRLHDPRSGRRILDSRPL